MKILFMVSIIALVVVMLISILKSWEYNQTCFPEIDDAYYPDNAGIELGDSTTLKMEITKLTNDTYAFCWDSCGVKMISVITVEEDGSWTVADEPVDGWTSSLYFDEDGNIMPMLPIKVEEEK